MPKNCGVVAEISNTRQGVLNQLEQMQNFCNSILNATHLMSMEEMKFPVEIENLGELRESTDFGHSESPNLLEGGPTIVENPRIDPPGQNRKHQRESYSSDSSNSPKRLHVEEENGFEGAGQDTQAQDVEMVSNEDAPTPLWMCGKNGDRVLTTIWDASTRNLEF